MEVICDEDYYPCEPCASCEKLYIEDIWLEPCCEEKECIHRVEYEKQREEDAIKHVAVDVALKYTPQEMKDSVNFLKQLTMTLMMNILNSMKQLRIDGDKIISDPSAVG